MSDKPELQAQLQEALGLENADFAYHAADLYVVAKPGVMEWLQANYEHVTKVTGFTSPVDSGWNGAGKHCYDIPFASENWLWKPDTHAVPANPQKTS